MLSEGRREALRLPLNRCLSEPGDTRSCHDPPRVPSPPGMSLMPPLAVSMPCSPCTESTTICRSLVLRSTKVLEASELACRVTRAHKGRPFLLLDLRTFIAFNRRHVRGAINISCCDRFNRKRLQLQKATVVDLAVSVAGRELLRRRSFRDIVVYDDATSDVQSLPTQHPVFLVLMALLQDSREPVLLKGGFSSFEEAYPELCESAREQCSPAVDSGAPQYATPGVGAGPPSPLDVSAIENAVPTEVWPLLYLGNAKNAESSRVLQNLGISRVLNVTPKDIRCPEELRLRCKTLPAFDSGQQNLRQYFEEAFAFIDEALREQRGVLVHCQAGVSRSPTIVIAYLMKSIKMSMVEAYKLVKSRRPIISPNLNFMGQLVEWEATLQASRAESGHKHCQRQYQLEQHQPKEPPSGACQA